MACIYLAQELTSASGHFGSMHMRFARLEGQAIPPLFGRFTIFRRLFCTALSPQVLEQGVHGPH